MDRIKEFEEKKGVRNTLYIAGLVILMVLVFLHVNVGVEVSDTGYSLANFVKFFSDSGTWVLATFLANFTGAVLTRLPFGSTMLGMQVYSHLMLAVFVAALYFYLPKIISRTSAFLGLVMAVCLTWCPKVILYNYLTYYLFTIAAILIFEAYKQKKDILLFIAGIVLSLSVFVRFPNICECLLIVPVIYNSVLGKDKFKDIMRKIALSLGGFFLGAVIISAIIMIIYGPSSYVDMIGSLFGMQSTDSSYSMRGMVESIVRFYVETLLELGGLLVATVVMAFVYNLVGKNKYVRYLCSSLWVCVICGYLLYAYKSGFFWRNYNDLTAVRTLATFLVICSVIVYVIIFFSKKADNEIKSLAMIMLIIIIVTPLGSNNALYPVYNNLFLIAPFDCYLLIQSLGKKDATHYIVNIMCVIVFGLLMLQSVLFGIDYTFKCDGYVEELETRFDKGILKGMCTNRRNKESLEGIMDYIDEGEYEGRQAICYGNIPALNYYIGVECPLSSSWPDLNTVLTYEMMKDEIENLDEKPMLIYTAAEEELILNGQELTDKETYLKEYMNDNEYIKVYNNDEYVIYDIIENTEWRLK